VGKPRRIMMAEIIIMTKEEWLEKGKELFGDDFFSWKFRCPNCGHIQSIEDFRQYKDQGANPNSAYQVCIGRFMDGDIGELGDGKSPCNYAACGLICLAPIIVIDGKTETKAFEFAHDETIKES
jgi:hypothetical protein